MSEARQPTPPESPLPLVVYVDDEEANRIVFQASLKGRYRIECFADGESAFPRIAAGEVAVLVTDQRMPGMTGNELLRKAQQIAPQTERVVITAYDDAGPILDALNSGLASRYLVKPWTREELVSTLESCLNVYRLREEKVALEHRLFQAERFVTLGAIAAGVFHDMSQPVLVIGTTIDSGVTDAEALDDIRGAIRHLEGMVRGAKSFLAHNAPREPGDPAEAIRAAVSLCSARIRHSQARLAVDVRTEPALAKVRLSTTQLIQVLVNLLVNSSQALRPDREGSIELSARADGEGVRITIRDDGIGMTPEVLAKVRQPFFTTKRAGEGTGLGLFTCQRAIEEAGGRMQIESSPSTGTAVTLSLPFA